MSYLADLAEHNTRRQGGAVLGAALLGGAVDDYLEWVARAFLRRDFTSRREILDALAEDHLREPLRAPDILSKAA